MTERQHGTTGTVNQLSAHAGTQVVATAERENDNGTTATADSGTNSTPLSKKMKLIQKHADQPESRIRQEIRSYLHYQTAADEDDPMAFWGKGLFPSLQKTAMKYLTRSASSVPVENMFSTMGLILNGKRSTLAPHRANWLSFIHDNFELYFDTN
jgi:hypothetical protein